MNPKIPRLLAISDRLELESRNPGALDPLLAWVARLEELGVDGVQIREKDLPDRRLLHLLEVIAHRHPRLTLLVNGRADIALAAGASGVHLPSDGVPVKALRNRFGQRLLIGVSTHYREEIVRALEDGADYATFGPVLPTPSKEIWGPPPGFRGLDQAVTVGLPVLALGGLDSTAIEAVHAAGAHGLAAIRAFHEEAEIRDLVAAAGKLWPHNHSIVATE